MKTLEEALIEIESTVSGQYRETFPNSLLRTATKDYIGIVKLNAETLYNLVLSKNPNQKLIENAISTMESIVIDNDQPLNERRALTYTDALDYAKRQSVLRVNPNDYVVKKLVDYCDDVIARLEETKGEGMTVKELNDKYEDKYLIFNGDEDGMQVVHVDNIHKLRSGEIAVDGTMIDFCNENHQDGEGILIYEIDDWPFRDFWYFPDENDEGEPLSPQEIDEELQSPPIDLDKKEFPTHVLTEEKVAKEIKYMINWILEDKGLNITL